MNGIINVHKPQDWTSFDVVNKLKRLLHTSRIGHLGTLDPMATGVLPVTVGSATKLFDMFLNKTKQYRAKFEFGYITDTLDATGQILNTTTNIPTKEQIKNVLDEFVGEIEQMPPQFSAKKVNGKKACDIARSGGEVELKPKTIFVKSIEFLSFENNVLEVDIVCGAGTYIRAIGRDLASKLNSLTTMTSLIRTKVGIFELKDAVDIRLEDENSILNKILPTDSVFDCPIINDETVVKRLLNGQTVANFDKLELNILNNNCNIQMFRLYLNDNFVAIAEVNENKLKMTKYFG